MVVETAEVINPDEEAQPDCLHPNNAGHADIAGAFAATIGDPFRAHIKRH
jgi:lysophospholipase L1-like esterase